MVNTNKSKENKERITVFLEQDLAERARIQTALDGKSIPEYIKELLDENLPRIKIHREKGDDKVMNIEFIEDKLHDITHGQKGTNMLEPDDSKERDYQDIPK